MIKKLISISLVLCTVLLIAGCSSDKCEHDFSEPTCTRASVCEECGEVKGAALGHDWIDLTCTEPKICRVCNITEGIPLGHRYNGKYCINCGMENPLYLDPEEIGFIDNYGANVWVAISAYDFGEGNVNLYNYVENNRIRVIVFYDNYWQEGYISSDELVSGTISGNKLDVDETEPCDILSNDVISHNGAFGWGSFTIIDRKISKDGKKIVIKTEDDTSSRYEMWYVPIAYLDFSTITGSEKDCYVSYKK